MAKEKISNIDKEKKEVTFYYEIIGVVFILLGIISITRLGRAGTIIALTFKLLFGDWYFLFIIFILYFGVKLLIKHTPIKIKTMRFIGFILIFICLLILSHSSFYKYISSYTNNSLKATLSFYLNAFKYQSFDDLSGGGILGTFFYYAFYLLFSSIGTIFIAIIILYVGICFIFQKTVFEFTNVIIGFFKSIFKKGIKVKNIFKYEIKQYPNKNYHIHINHKWFKNQVITNVDIVNKEYENIVFSQCQKVINSYHFFYEEIKKISSLHMFLIIIKTYHLFNLDSFHKYLKNNLGYPFLLRKNANQIFLEFNTKNPYGYSFTNALLTNKCVLGIDPFNEIIEYDINKNYLIIGNNYHHFLAAIEYLLINKYENNKEFVIIDDNFPSYQLYKRQLKDLFQIFDESERRLQKINDHNFSNFNDYNHNNSLEQIIDKIIIIDKFDYICNSIDLKELFFKFLNIAQTTGYHVIALADEDFELSKLEEQLFNVKIITNNNFEITKNFVNPVVLNTMSNVEGIYLEQNEEMRIAMTLLSSEENKILNEKLKEKRK